MFIGSHHTMRLFTVSCKGCKRSWNDLEEEMMNTVTASKLNLHITG